MGPCCCDPLLPLDEAIDIAHKVASGDLTSNIVVTSTKSSTGRLLQARLKEMNDSLIDLVGKVRSSTDQITTASGEIASGNLDLSQRTEEQASSLEETASSIQPGRNGFFDGGIDFNRQTEC